MHTYKLAAQELMSKNLLVFFPRFTKPFWIPENMYGGIFLRPSFDNVL